MGSVSFLPVQEWADIDGAFLDEVIAQLGPEAAERMIEDTLAALQRELTLVAALTVNVAQVARRDDNSDHSNPIHMRAPLLGDLVAATDRLSRTAWEIGLTTLSGVAVDLALCAERVDHTALHAVAARLQRVGACSLGPAWDEAIFG